jgi:hypothetical protein
MGIEIARGDPRRSQPGTAIVIPEHPTQLAVVDLDLDQVRRSYLRNAIGTLPPGERLAQADIAFLADETRTTLDYVREVLGGNDGSAS